MIYVGENRKITYDLSYLNNFISLQDVFVDKSDNSVHVKFNHIRNENYDL